MNRLLHNQKVMITAITLVLLLTLSQATFAQRVLFPAGLFDKIRIFIFGDNAIHASDYKDGTILLIKPIATGVGDGRYEAGDIVSILDGEEMYKRFGDSDFLGYEEKSKLIPLYLKQKLTAEQKTELLASEYETHPVSAPSASSGSEPPLLLEGNYAGAEKADEKIPSKKRGAPSVNEGRGVSGDDNRKMTKRRIYGVDYTLVLSDKDILTIRQEKPLNKIPEVKFEEIINKGTKLSYAVPATHPVFGSANATPNPPLFLEGIYAGGATDEKIPSNKRGAPSRVEGRGVYCESSASVVCLPKHLAIMEKAIKTTKRLAAVIVPNVRAATEFVKTVDTGGYADYTSLSAWEAANQADLTLSDTIAIAKCRHATATSTVDSTRVDLDGWTTDATRYIKIWTDPTESYRHNGKWDGAKYNLSVSNNSAMYIYEDYVRLDGLQIAVPSGNANGQTPVTYQGTTDTNDIQISNCIIKGHGNASYSQSGFWAGTSNHVALKMWNTIIYNILPASGNTGIYAYGSNSTASHVYNVTISGGQYGIHWVSGTAYIKNVIAFNTSSYDFNTVTYQINCASEDATADDCDGDGVSGNNRISQTFIFADKANNDLRLYATDNTAQDYGTSSVSAIGFTTDISGQTRTGTWDIGADEMIARPIYRSVGPSKTDALATGAGNPMTINGYTATFASSVPDNVGVGDVIQYDRDNNNTIDSVAFISGRTDSTHYNVQSADGWMASSTMATSTIFASAHWSIFRAYSSLANADVGTENAGLNDGVEQFDAVWSAAGGKNIASSTEQWNIACYGDAADTDLVEIDNWVTSTSTYIKVYTPKDTSEVGVSQRHEGKWDDNKYRLTGTGSWLFYSSEEYVVLDGLQVYNSGAGTDTGGIIFADSISNAGVHIEIKNNLIKGANPSDTSGHSAIMIGSVSAPSTLKVYNNIIYDISKNAGDWIGGLYIGNSIWDIYVYNNTFINTGYGIRGHGDNPGVVKNNITQNCTAGFYLEYGSWETGSDYNISDIAGDAPGSNSKNGVKVKFARPEQGDFHLVSSDAVAKDAGANLSADTNLPFNTDIDGQTRPPSASSGWDIGADEVSNNITKVGTNPYARFDDPNLVGYWSFDGASMGTTSAQDLSGNGNTGWLYSYPTNYPQKVSGIIGQALKFTPGATFPAVAIGDMSATENISQLTISFWAKTENFRNSEGGCYVGKRDINSGDNSWFICQEGDNFDTFPADIHFGIGTSTDPYLFECYTETDILADKDGQWVHITAVYDGTQYTGNQSANDDVVKIYVDGQFQYFDSTDGCTGVIDNKTRSNDIPAAIGNDYNPYGYYQYRGLIDEVRIYNKALSQDEITDLYRAGSAKLNTNDSYKGDGSGLVGWWTFDGADINWTTNTAYNNPGVFPATGILDNFNRSNEGPPPSASWLNAVSGVSVVSNQAQGVNTTPNLALWNTAYTDQEAYLTMVTPPAGNSDFVVGVRFSTDGYRGYIVDYVPAYSSNANQDTLVLGRSDAGALAVRKMFNKTLSAGDSIGIRAIGPQISGYYRQGSGDWIKFETLTDSTYASGLTGIALTGTTPIADNYGGGSLGNHGTMYNMSTTTSGVSGISGQALKFDGGDDYVEIPGSSAIDDLATATFSFWFNSKESEGLFIGKDLGDSGALQIFSYPDRRVQLTRKYASDHLQMICEENAYDLNKWTHLAVTYSGLSSNNAHIYIDGVECSVLGQQDGVGEIASEAGDPLVINYFISASMDDVRVYNRALSASEIADLYKLGQRRMKVKAR